MHKNHKGATLNSLVISEMSLPIFSYTCSLLASSFGKKKRFSSYNHPHILCMCSKAFYSDDRLLCDIEISGKTQNYRLKSVCNFKLTRFYLILLCKQHNWTSGIYSIEIIIIPITYLGIEKSFVIFDFFFVLFQSVVCSTGAM